MPGQPERALEFHSEIYRAIEVADPDAAEQAMARHMDQTIEIYWMALAQ
jgi:DNA-binding FadR family transcriptional regulator